MSNLTESSTFTPDVYEIAESDPVQGGPGGIDNQPHQALANRTRWLYDRVNKLFTSLKVSGNTTVGAGSTSNVNGSAYTMAFPLASPDYTTPNDGITRTYQVTLSFDATFTESAGNSVYLSLYTTTSGTPGSPTEILRMRQFQNGSITYSNIVTIAPNTLLKLAMGNATANSGTLKDILLILKEI